MSGYRSTAARRAPRAPGAAADPIQVLVVDDSAVVRGLISRWLDKDPQIVVVGSAANGELALREAARLRPELVVLDIEMPVMDGLTALPKLLRQDRDLKVVISSTLTARNADISIRAMQAGAADYIAKPTSRQDLAQDGGYRRELIEKIKAIAGAGRLRPRAEGRALAAASSAPMRARPEGGLYGKAPITLRGPGRARAKVIAIGSSTGGPQALMTLVPALPATLRQPILIVQHMPAMFTTILAEHLNRRCEREVGEAVDGEALRDGRVYVAPGDHHMVLEQAASGPVVRLHQGPQENFCRPAVDPLFRSLAQCFGGDVLALVLTGMGHDGLAGAQVLTEAGGTLLAQDEASSVVWGMPGAVATGGLCSAVLPIGELGPAARRLAMGEPL